MDLRLAALIAPDQRGPDDAGGMIEDDEAVHLAGQTDAADIGAGRLGLGEDTANGLSRGVPPVFGPLLGPPGRSMRMSSCGAV